MKFRLLLLVCSMTWTMTGCTVVRQIDQWKCDTFGWCLPGIVPSGAYPYAYPPAYQTVPETYTPAPSGTYIAPPAN